jgi:ribosome biogenesis GTPase
MLTHDPASESMGLVISYFGQSVSVEAKDGSIYPCHLRRNQALPVVGDQVIWQMGSAGQGTISRILPRRSLLMRGDARGNMKLLAANIDYLVIVMAPLVLSEYLIDRYLVAAELLQLPAFIIFNKIDLLKPEDLENVKARLQMYEEASYQIVFTSIFIEKTLSDVLALLKQKGAVLVGPSGVGKSSLIAALGSREAIRVGDVSPKGAGKHTTTATRLYHLPQGGHLIDSPGVREFNLWSVSPEVISQGFKEFQPFLTRCQFKDCQHITEPGCAVQAALKSGKIHPARYASYQQLMQQATIAHQPKRTRK